MSPTRLSPRKREGPPDKAGPLTPEDFATMFRDLHERVVRIEARQVKHMQANGIDSFGHPLPEAESAPRMERRRK